MARRTAISAVLAALALLASTACGGGGAKGNAGANPTLATDPPRTNPTLATVPAPTTTTNPYAVPAVIDAAYVNRVLAGLDGAVGQILRIIKQTDTIPREAYDRLTSIYADPEFLQIKIDGYQRDIREGFRSYRPTPGDRHSVVSRIITASAACIFVQIDRDYAAVGLNPSAELQTQWVGLRPLDKRQDPNGYNPTAWAFVYDGFQPDHSPPSDPCVRQ